MEKKTVVSNWRGNNVIQYQLTHSLQSATFKYTRQASKRAQQIKINVEMLIKHHNSTHKTNTNTFKFSPCPKNYRWINTQQLYVGVRGGKCWVCSVPLKFSLRREKGKLRTLNFLFFRKWQGVEYFLMVSIF